MRHHNSPIGRRSTGPHIARKAAAHIQRNAAKPGRDWMGGRPGQIDPSATAAPPPGGSTPMPPDTGGMGGGLGGGGGMDDQGLGGL